MLQIRYFSLLLLLCVVALAQQSTGSAATQGNCSPANTGNNNTFNITCQGISTKLGAQLVDLLNRVANNQLDAEAVMGKLDGCLQGVREVREQQANRHLSDEQKDVLSAALRPFKGMRVTVTAMEGNPEAYGYAEDFAAVFREAGLSFVEVSGGPVNTGSFLGGRPLTGVVILPKDEAEWRTAIVQTFNDALKIAAVQHSAMYIGKMRMKDTDLEVFVAPKP